jgi:peptidoglycan hydrolase-like protein with peptidoglycan-binding domain
MTTRGRNRIRNALVATGLTVASLGVAVTTAAPAVADGSYTGRSTVWGSGTFSGDWDDEGVNNVSVNRVSNATCLWQMVLHADGYLDISDLDGIFGDRTHAATVRWQQARGLTGDGSAGRLSWAKAGDRLVDTGDDTSGYRTGYYRGTRLTPSLGRTPAGVHQFWDTDGGVYRTASYNTRTCR